SRQRWGRLRDAMPAPPSRRALAPCSRAGVGGLPGVDNSKITRRQCRHPQTSFRNRLAPTGLAVGLAHMRYATLWWRFAPAASFRLLLGPPLPDPVRSRIRHERAAT